MRLGKGLLRPLCAAAGVAMAVTVAAIVTTTNASASTAGDRIAQIATAEQDNSAHNHMIGNCNFYGGQLYGTIPGCPSGWRTGDWCADFAKYVWRQAGSVSYLAEIDSWAQSFKDYGVRHGTWHPTGGGYAPRPGDAIVYKDLGGQQGKADHVGVVVAYSSGTLTTIEGNYNSRVYRRVNPANAQGFTSPVVPADGGWSGWQSPPTVVGVVGSLWVGR